MNLPIYVQIAKHLQDKINRDILQPGNMIPSENELAKEFHTSRPTVRKSLFLLLNEGYICAVHGKGYFVQAPEQNKYTLYFNEMNVSGRDTKLASGLAVDIVSPTLELIFQLQIAKDTKLIRIRRILSSEQKPVAYDIKYLLYDKGKPIVEEEIKYATFPEMVAKKASLFSVRKELKIKCTAADELLSSKLNLPAGFPLVLIEQKFFRDHAKPIAWGQTYYNSEHFELSAVHDSATY